MINFLHFLQADAAAGLRAISIEAFKLLSPAPTPQNECRVTPPTRHAATPVDAVTTRLSGGNEDMILLNKYDFPLPAAPVKKTLLPLKQAKNKFNKMVNRCRSCHRKISVYKQN